MPAIENICILGFGEVGQILADDLGAQTGISLSAFDLLFDDESSIPSRAVSARPEVTAYPTAPLAAADRDLIISAVTAAQATAAARSVLRGLTTGAYYMDMNSVSPQTRRDASELIESAGGRFVEAALMAPIAPRRIEAPILLGGRHAQQFAPHAATIGFSGAQAFSPDIGPASAVKMSRSVIIKGMEALLTESLTTARHFHVEDEVLSSLSNLLPLDDWRAKARYMVSRSLQHGERRAAEMREVAETVAEAGIDPLMSKAAVQRQQWAAQFATMQDAELAAILDTLLDPSEGSSLDG